jgi:hypothetical protein
MRWYDYIVCLWLADMLSASIVNQHFLLLFLSVISYISYESMRKQQVK